MVRPAIWSVYIGSSTVAVVMRFERSPSMYRYYTSGGEQIFPCHFLGYLRP